MYRATTASGNVMKKTEPQSNWVSSAPAIRGPSAEIPPPRPDHSAMDFVRSGPDHSAVISASVVGYAMPAAIPPRSRARKRTSMDGARAASRETGIASPVPRRSISLRP